MSEPTKTGQPVIMIIDDEEIVGMVTGHSLRRRGFVTLLFVSAEEAIAHLEDDSIHVDAVITDYAMPEMTGLDLASRLRVIRPGVPVVICSGYVDAINNNAAQCLGIAARLNKPVNQDTLEQTLRAVMP